MSFELEVHEDEVISRKNYNLIKAFTIRCNYGGVIENGAIVGWGEMANHMDGLFYNGNNVYDYLILFLF